LHGLFEELPEQQSAKTRTTPIEAKCELVKAALQMIWLDGALVRAEKPSFEQGRNPIDPGALET